MANDTTLRQCRYYKGEDRNPYPVKDIRHTFWEIEFIYCDDINENEQLRETYQMELLADFRDAARKWEGVPLRMTALIYAMYYQSGGTKTGFPDIMRSYING